MQTLKKFIKYYKPYKAVFFIDLLCATIISAIDLAFPQLLRTLTKTLFAGAPGKIISALIPITIGLLVAYIIQTACRYYVTYAGHMMGARMERDMRKELFDQYEKLSFSYYDQNNSGQMMSKLVSDLFDISELAHHGPENLFISLIKIIGSFIFLFMINRMLAVPMLILVVLMLVFSYGQNKKMQETETITNALIEKANEKERQSEYLDRAISEKRSRLNKEKGSELLNAAVGWATGKSKALRNEIEDLRNEISTHEETIERLQDKIQTIQSDHHRELMKLESRHQSELSRKEAEHTQETTRLKNRIAWQSHIIDCLSFLLLKTNDIFRKAVYCVVRFARDYYKSRFDTEQVSDIKSALNLFGEDRQSHRAAGDFLYFTAKQKGGFDNREQIKARREVDNVVEGHYDQQQKRGFSMRR